MLPAVVEDMLAQGNRLRERRGDRRSPTRKGNIPHDRRMERKKEDPPAIIRKRDGAFTYTTSDLATIKYRAEEFRRTRCSTSSAFAQALHFKTLFAQARRWGYDGVGAGAHQFRLRAGQGQQAAQDARRHGDRVAAPTRRCDPAWLGRSIAKATNSERHSATTCPTSRTTQVQDIAEAIGSGAVKYADLSQNRNSDYKSDADKMLATDGNTATYMQYAYARCRSIFRKGQVDESRFRQLAAAGRDHPSGRAGAGAATGALRGTLDAAAAEYLPHFITGYLWDLAKAFSGFFENCPVLTAETPELRDSRLLLVDLSGRVIRQALDLLGIRTVERM